MFGLKKQPFITDDQKIIQILERRLEPTGIFPNKEEVVTFLKTKPCRVYLGIDPTGPDIHLGHTIPLLFLRQLWDLGHIPVIVIGDFTARIGDPTDKDATRKPLSPEQIKQNSSKYLDQIYKILPKGSFEVHHNAHWLDKLSFKDVVKLASHLTVQQMIQRDMFQGRLKNNQPIGLHEFLYPLMQGYDSVAMEIDGEVGGNDQTFNMLVGRTLEKKLIDKEKVVFATRLLSSSETGKKMSKSEGELIVLSDSPQEIRRKVLMIDDSVIKTWFELCTEESNNWIEQKQQEINAGKNPREWKEELSDELVRMYHGERAIDESRKPRKTLGGTNIVSTMTIAGIASSASLAKELIDQGAVKVNGEPVRVWNFETKKGDVIKSGKGIEIEIDRIVDK